MRVYLGPACGMKFFIHYSLPICLCLPHNLEGFSICVNLSSWPLQIYLSCPALLVKGLLAFKQFDQPCLWVRDWGQKKTPMFLMTNWSRDQTRVYLPFVVTISIPAAATTAKSFRLIMYFVCASSGVRHCPEALSTSSGSTVLYSLGCVCWMCSCPWDVLRLEVGEPV